MNIQLLLRRFLKDESSFTSPLTAWIRTTVHRVRSRSSPAVVEDQPASGSAILIAQAFTDKEARPMDPTAQTSGSAVAAEGELDDDLITDVFGHVQAQGDGESLEEAPSLQADDLKPQGEPEPSLKKEEVGQANTEETASLQAGAMPESATDDNPAAGTDIPQAGGEPPTHHGVEALILDEEAQGNDNPEAQVSLRRDPPQDTSAQGEREQAGRSARQRRTDKGPPKPLVRTMVESLATGGGEGEGGTSLLPEALEELFQHKESRDPRVKMLLMELETVDVRELKRELTDFAQSIGAIPDQE